MRKMLSIICLILLLLVGCEAKSTQAEKDVNSLKPSIPFNERKFIYKNGIDIAYQDVTSKDENDVKVYRYYPQISGLKDKNIQEKINKKVQEAGDELLSQLDAKLTASKKQLPKINQKNASAYISYNCNNVICVEYNASIDIPGGIPYAYPHWANAFYGYDLNTADEISLDEVFKPGVDYKTKINNFICQYIIENNYDDYESQRMTKPFQGIRDNQSFMFNTTNLIILLDEKNDEFMYMGYPEFVPIPLKALQDDLYIFDRYFEEKKNIFEQEKLAHELLPNDIEYKHTSLLQEGEKEYFFEIIEGEFIHVPDKQIEKKLNEMAKCCFDINAFKETAKAEARPDRMSSYNFQVSVFLNAGGYLSIASTEYISLGDRQSHVMEPFNYDFNTNRELKIEDIYTGLRDLEEEIKIQIKRRQLPISDHLLDASAKEAVNKNKFYFNELGITVYFSPEDVKLDEFDKWLWLPWAELSKDKIKFLQ